MNANADPKCGKPARFGAVETSGFTLMEMMAVIIIIMMMTVMAVPAFRGFYRKTQEDTVAAQLARLLRYAHQKAVYRSQVTRVDIELEKGEFWVFVPAKESDRFSQAKKELESVLPRFFAFESIWFPEVQKRQDRGRVSVHFFPDGSAEEARIVLLSEQAGDFQPKRILVFVRPNTGKIVTRVLEAGEDVEDFL
ncbi:MAG TPA: hypothetical protein PKH07_09510 [bacterium]|nr:hypothetical protein [bacterium]